jgi:hypothetical protein
MLEVDWASLIKSFYEMVRIKVAYRNPSKIPSERLYEMDKKLYLISISVEGLGGGDLTDKDAANDDDDDHGDEEDDSKEDDGFDDLDDPRDSMDMDKSSGKDPGGTTLRGSGSVGVKSGGSSHQIVEQDQSPKCIADLYKCGAEVRISEGELMGETLLHEDVVTDKGVLNVLQESHVSSQSDDGSYKVADQMREQTTKPNLNLAETEEDDSEQRSKWLELVGFNEPGQQESSELLEAMELLEENREMAICDEDKWELPEECVVKVKKARLGEQGLAGCKGKAKKPDGGLSLWEDREGKQLLEP